MCIIPRPFFSLLFHFLIHVKKYYKIVMSVTLKLLPSLSRSYQIMWKNLFYGFRIYFMWNVCCFTFVIHMWGKTQQKKTSATSTKFTRKNHSTIKIFQAFKIREHTTDSDENETDKPAKNGNYSSTKSINVQKFLRYFPNE